MQLQIKGKQVSWRTSDLSSGYIKQSKLKNLCKTAVAVETVISLGVFKDKKFFFSIYCCINISDEYSVSSLCVSRDLGLVA